MKDTQRSSLISVTPSYHLPRNNLLILFYKSVDQLENLCETEENTVENKEEEISDEDDVELSSNEEEQTDVSTENHLEENLDQLEAKSKRICEVDFYKKIPKHAFIQSNEDM